MLTSFSAMVLIAECDQMAASFEQLRLEIMRVFESSLVTSQQRARLALALDGMQTVELLDSSVLRSEQNLQVAQACRDIAASVESIRETLAALLLSAQA